MLHDDGQAALNLYPAQEAPEVRKALKQVFATAVKHGATQVDIELDRERTQAVFHVPKKGQINVTIPVSPVQFTASLLARAQIVSRAKDSFKAVARVQFKSLSADCSCEIFASPRSAKRSVTLKDFLVGVSENPTLWFGITSLLSESLRKLFEPTNGVIVVACASRTARVVVLNALTDACGARHVVDAGSSLKNIGALLQDARSERMVVGVNQPDVFPVLRELGAIDASLREVIRGVFSYQRLPRLCFACAEPDELSSDLLEKAPAHIDLQQGDLMKAVGCDLCAGSGFIGSVGVGSVVDFSGPVGKALCGTFDFSAILSQLAETPFEPQFENALRFVRSGKTTLATVLGKVPLCVPEYKSLQTAENTESKPAEDDDNPLKRSALAWESLDGAAAFERRFGTEETPFHGREAFYQRRSEGLQKKNGDVLQQEPLSRLLVIDDDADQREILKHLLELEGFAVNTAADGVDGVLTAVKTKPDLIIVDYMMPDFDGRDTIVRLRSDKSFRDTPIVVLTAYPDPELEFSLLDAGADDFCSKAMSKKVLLKRIQRLL